MAKDQLACGNSGKAGLPSSLNEINSKITETSKDSRFTAAQERKAAELEMKIEGQKEQLAKTLGQPQALTRARKLVDGLMETFEKDQLAQYARSEEFCWVCVDMDAFFASVESLDAPELKDVPMAVGGASMLSTSNYAARKYGVSAAMPGYIAQKLCPQLIIVPLRYERYRELSGKVAEILSKYDPNLSMWSLDEAFLRLNTDEEGLSFVERVQAMRDEVRVKTGLTCSAGIAANPLLAKLASNYQKPDGQFEINRQNLKEMRSFLFEQPVRKLSGIGKVMSLTLERVFGVAKIGEMYGKRHLLPLIFKEKTVRSLIAKCIGHCEDEVGSVEEAGQKSLSCERTFQAPKVNILEVLNEIVENITNDMKEMGIVEVGRVGIKVKSSDFRVFTREKTVGPGKSDLLKITTTLLNEFLANEEGFEMRLLGVRLTSLKYAKTVDRKRPQTALEDWLEEGKQSTAKCPICGKAFKDENDLNAVNGHVDECLTKTVLKEEMAQSIK